MCDDPTCSEYDFPDKLAYHNEIKKYDMQDIIDAAFTVALTDPNTGKCTDDDPWLHALHCSPTDTARMVVNVLEGRPPGKDYGNK